MAVGRMRLTTVAGRAIRGPAPPDGDWQGAPGGDPNWDGSQDGSDVPADPIDDELATPDTGGSETAVDDGTAVG